MRHLDVFLYGTAMYKVIFKSLISTLKKTYTSDYVDSKIKITEFSKW
jgi:hypothetical protein